MYDVYFDYIAILLLSSLLFVHTVYYDGKSLASKFYRLFLAGSLIETILDVVSALSIDGRIVFSDRVSIIVLTLFYLFMHFNSCLGYILVCESMKSFKKINLKIAGIWLAVGLIYITANAFTGVSFTFADGKYISGPLAIIVSVISIPYIFFIIFFHIKRKNASAIDKMGPFYLVLFIILSNVIQRIFPTLLVACLGKALAAIIFCTYYDTPEHIQLKNMVEELKISQKKEESALNALEEANKSKTEFLVGMSHRLRTPINSITGFTEILIKESGNLITRAKAEELYNSANRLLSYVKQIENFSQLEMGLVEINPEEYTVTQSYRLIYERLHRIIGKSMSIDNVIDPTMPKRLYGDDKLICQILEVIFGYIVKHCNEGDITIFINNGGIDKNKVKVILSVVYRNGDLNILGSNIKDDADYIFINRLFEAVGNQINISFDKDKGNVFNFSFEQEIVDMKSVGDVKNTIANGLDIVVNYNDKPPFIMPTANILAVDDTPLNLKVLEGLLSPYKVRVTTADSGIKALEKMCNEKFDLVFMDILMPGLDGIETLKAIREDESIRDEGMPVIALTANVFIGARDKYLADGFADYITKPVTGKNIEEILKHFLPDKLETDWANIDVSEEDVEDIKTDTKDKYSSFLDDKLSFSNVDKTNASPEDKYSNFLLGNTAKKDREKSGTDEKSSKAVTPFDKVAGLNVKKGLELCGNNMNLYREVYKDYCTKTINGELEAYYVDKDWDNYRILIHGVKSASRTIGLDAIADSALKLEEAARALDIDYIDNHHRSWIEEYIKTTKLMTEEL